GRRVRLREVLAHAAQRFAVVRIRVGRAGRGLRFGLWVTRRFRFLFPWGGPVPLLVRRLRRGLGSVRGLRRPGVRSRFGLRRGGRDLGNGLGDGRGWFQGGFQLIERLTAEVRVVDQARRWRHWRSEEHTSELQSRENLVCRLLLDKKKKKPDRD